MNRVKKCPVCGELVAFYQGDPDKYGEKAVWNYYQSIRLKYDCDECWDMMKGQSTRLSNKRRRAERREQRTALLDVLDDTGKKSSCPVSVSPNWNRPRERNRKPCSAFRCSWV